MEHVEFEGEPIVLMLVTRWDSEALEVLFRFEDLLAVLRHERVPWLRLARLAGVSLRSSPRSTQLALFRRHVEHFFSEHGCSVWGARFEGGAGGTRVPKVGGDPDRLTRVYAPARLR